MENKIVKLFEEWSNENSKNIVALPKSGSDRQYFRIFGETKTVIGVYNSDKKENTAFLEFTKHFYNQGLDVPEILAENFDENIYLLNDLGDTTLYAYLTEVRKDGSFPESLKDIYKNVLEELPKFQVEAGKTLDYSNCYPRPAFDKQSMMWDLSYFKYYFLKLAKIPFDEQLLEDDFQLFTDYLLATDCNYFLYRDFQSRNIMIKDGKPHFIDYQGGRKGALHYDLASLLFDAKADIPQDIREELLNYYIDVLSKLMPVNKEKFVQNFYGYVLIRIMQAMGAYGFRGFYEKKEHFLKSIPFALSNLELILKNIEFPIEISYLLNILKELTKTESLKKFGSLKQKENKLKVKIFSFSYKKGFPVDDSGNGGGHVFDCRAIHNPGRYEKYKQLTGKDKEVIEFFADRDDMHDFLTNVFAIADLSVGNYVERGFESLMISFGCTGGQHRSVYCAENLVKHIREKYNVDIELHHIEQEMKEKFAKV